MGPAKYLGTTDWRAESLVTEAVAVAMLAKLLNAIGLLVRSLAQWDCSEVPRSSAVHYAGVSQSVARLVMTL